MRFLTKLWSYLRLGKFPQGGATLVLGTPTLVSPTDGYTTADMTTYFDWTDVLGATLYRIRIASDPGMTVIVETGTSLVSNYTSAGLTTGQIYYWDVRAEAGAIFGSYTAPFTLNTLGDVTLNTPADTSFTNDITPTLDWFDTSHATGYIVEIATTNAFGASIIETGTPAVSTYTAATIGTDAIYYWRVRPTAEGGVEVGTNSATWSFELFNFRKCWAPSTNDYGTIAASGTWRNQAKLEFCGWINPTDMSAIQEMFYAYYDASNRIVCQLNDNAATGQWFVAWYVNAATAYANSVNKYNYGANYFIYLGFDGPAAAANRYKICINAISDCTITGTPPTAIGNAGNLTTYIGSSNVPSLYFNGQLDHFAVRYNRTLLTPTEITALYNSGYGRRYQDVATFDSIWEFGATGNISDEGLDGKTIVPAAAPGTPTVQDWVY